MSFRNGSLGVFLLIAAATVLGSGNSSQTKSANSIELIITIKDTIAISGQHDVRIPVRMSNFFDTVGGFEMRVTTDHPEIVSLSRSLDTTGCLAGGWEYIGTEFIGSDSDTVRIFGMANAPYPLGTHPGIAPQYGSVPLFYLKANIIDFKDTLDTMTAAVKLPTDDVEKFMFSTSSGVAIGLDTISISDTLRFHCESWEGDTCLLWNEFGGPPWDSIEVAWTSEIVLDTAKVKVVDGSLEVRPAQCGDVNGFDGVVNLQDIAALISYIYLGGAQPPSLWAANVNGSDDGKLNLQDITYLISAVYLGGPPPACL